MEYRTYVPGPMYHAPCPISHVLCPRGYIPRLRNVALNLLREWVRRTGNLERMNHARDRWAGNTSPHTQTPAPMPGDQGTTPRALFTLHHYCKLSLTPLNTSLPKRYELSTRLTPPYGPVKRGQEGATLATILITEMDGGWGGRNGQGGRDD